MGFELTKPTLKCNLASERVNKNEKNLDLKNPVTLFVTT